MQGRVSDAGEMRRVTRLIDEARFFRAWVENPMITGAVSPSGRYLARRMARYVDPAIPGPVIELGPGTGPVTQALIARGIAPERLILIEFDPAFCDLLRSRFPQCRVVQGDAYQLARTLAGVLDCPAAAIVSSLPLLTRPETVRLGLLRQAFRLMREDGCFVQFTYGMVSPLPCSHRRPAEAQFDAEASPPVWLNLPPARVWVYRRPGQPADRPARLLMKLQAGIKEHRDRMGRQIRLHTDRARRELGLHCLRVRQEPAFRPALELLRRIGEQRRLRD